MFINSTGYYIPETRIDNSYLAQINNSTEDWYLKRTGIITRARANDKETINYMSVEAVKAAMKNLPYDIHEVDLIIFASYTPSDTISTTAHVIQKEFNIDKARAFYISSACSSAVNGMEIIKSFFETKISKKALLVCADQNSQYSNDRNKESGHLWGDAATALFFSAEQIQSKEAHVIDVISRGLGNIGKGPEAITLNPKIGIEMPYGKDVFTEACIYMTEFTELIVKKNNHTVEDLSYFIGHQANKRIISYVCNKLGISESQSLTNIEELGNTGCASAPLVFSQNYNKFKTDDLICLSVFGGGYSSGTSLIRIT